MNMFARAPGGELPEFFGYAPEALGEPQADGSVNFNFPNGLGLIARNIGTGIHIEATAFPEDNAGVITAFSFNAYPVLRSCGYINFSITVAAGEGRAGGILNCSLSGGKLTHIAPAADPETSARIRLFYDDNFERLNTAVTQSAVIINGQLMADACSGAAAATASACHQVAVLFGCAAPAEDAGAPLDPEPPV